MPHTPPTSLRRLLGLCLCALSLATSQAATGSRSQPVASAATARQVNPSKAAQAAKSNRGARPEKPKKAQRSRVIVPRNNEETRAERERRMLRECRGKPNAGACEGYAS